MCQGTRSPRTCCTAGASAQDLGVLLADGVTERYGLLIATTA
jgi:hypothetical protein